MKFAVFLFCLAAFALLTIAGCGSSPSSVSSTAVHPNAHRPFEALTTTPLVECVGDDICIGLVAAANGPNSTMWRCDDCRPGAVSGQVLANLPLALAKKPDVVLIMTGSYDVDDPNWSPACNGTSPNPDLQTCNNITEIAKEADAAGSRVIFSDVITWEGGTLSAQLAPDYDIYGVDLVNDNIDFLDHGLSDGYLIQEGAPSQFVDFASDFGDPDFIGPNGIDPSTQGYQAMLAAVEPVIEKLHAGGNK